MIIKSAMVLLTLVIGVAAQSPADSITGKFVNESGQPIPNAVVFAIPEGKANELVSMGTDREGAFKFSGLDGVPYYLSASMPSYLNPMLDPCTGRSAGIFRFN